ncbi:MerR family transcriptional regulator [Priestia endophytica]
MKEEKWFSVQQVADELDVPGSTVRRYLTQFSDFLEIKKSKNKNFINSDSLEVLKEIRDLFADKKNIEQVRERLASHRASFIDVEEEDVEVKSSAHEQPTTYVDLEETENRIAEKVYEKIEVLIKAQFESMQNHNNIDELKSYLKQRDEEMTKMMNYMKAHEKSHEQQMIEEVAAARESNPTKRWWQIWKSPR